MIELERNALVWGVVGNLGGGKTLSAVNLGVDCLLKGYFIVSNVTFDLDKISLDFNAPWVKSLYLHVCLDDSDFDPFKLPCGDPRGSQGTRRVIVILDEVAEWFDQYQSGKDKTVQKLWSWLRHSSKRSQDVVIICQRQEFIHKVVRSLIARWIWVDDLAVYRVPHLRFKFPFCAGLVMQNVFDRFGNRIGGVSFISKKRWGKYYNTAECLNSSGSSYCSVYIEPERKAYIPQITVLLFLGSYFYLLKILILR